MRQLLLIAAVALVLTSYGCGGGGGGDGVSPNAPVISNLYYSPKTTSTLTTDVTGSVTFHDIEGNIATFTLNIYENQSGAQVDTTTVNIAGSIGGATDGYFNILVTVGTSVPGNYTFGIHVTDSAGLQSNVLSGPFTVN